MKSTILTFFCLFPVLCFSQDIKGAEYTPAAKWNNAGYDHLLKGNYTKAIPLFNNAIATDPTTLNFYYNLAEAYINIEDSVNALETYFSAKAQFPKEADIYMFIGDIYQSQNKYREAIQEYDQAIAAATDEHEYKYLYFFNRGNIFLKSGEYKFAIKDYTKTLEIFPDYYGAYANRGIAYFKEQNSSSACRDWSKALDKGYENVEQYIKQYCK